MQAKISVIVPVYRVEIYLCECLNSILSQTYSNLEIILVDDGSPDNCGAICDEYAKKDDRIIVIHKENGGLSDARNVGIEIATGDYIGFVDSDDYVEKDMFERLLGLINKHQVSISVCAFYRNAQEKNTFVKEEVRFSKEEVFSEMAQNKRIASHAWNKLYHANLFQGIRYPLGKTYEDIYTTYKLMDKVDKIAYISEPLYYYRMNELSISNTKFNIHDLCIVEGSEELLKYLQEYYPQIAKHQQDSVCRNTIAVLRKIAESDFDSKDIISQLTHKISKIIFPYIFSKYKLSSKLFGIMSVINFDLSRKCLKLLHPNR